MGADVVENDLEIRFEAGRPAWATVIAAEKLKALCAVQHQRDWAVVNKRYIHHRLELSRSNIYSLFFQKGDKTLIKLLCFLGPGSADK